jgi:heat shock protein beta
MERLMAAQARDNKDELMTQFFKTQKRSLEINPRHPLIEGLLDRVLETEGDEVAQEDLRETVKVLWDTALVKSGFNVRDANAYVFFFFSSVACS